MFETIESSEERSQDANENSLPSWVPAAGAVFVAIFFLNVLLRLATGTGRFGLTAAGLRLLDAGFSLDTATALDMGTMSTVMALCLILSLLPLLMGIIGLFKRGEKRNAVLAIATGLCLWVFIFLLVLI